MKRIPILIDVLFGLVLAAISVAFFAVRERLWLLSIIVPAYVALNLLAGVFRTDAEGLRLRLLNHGRYKLTKKLPYLGCLVAKI